MAVNKTSIPWCDYTWNPITGCSPASEGCNNCYAEAIARRFKQPWGRPVFHPERVDEPRKMLGKWHAKHGRKRIFVCSTSDFFHPEIKPEWRDKVWGIVTGFSCFHTFIFLTKRADIMHDELWRLHNQGRMNGYWENIWVGVTAENQKRLDERVPFLIDLHWCKKFVSLEPLLESVNVAPYLLSDYEKRQFDNQMIVCCDTKTGNKLDWVIAGPENGPKSRACMSSWIDEIRDDCEEFNVPFFDKRPFGNPVREYPI